MGGLRPGTASGDALSLGQLLATRADLVPPPYARAVLDQSEFMRGFQRLADRLTLGMALAALIVGAAMSVRVETSSKLLG